MATIRDDGPTIGSGVTPGSSGGTVRGGGPDITSGMHGTSPVSAGLSLNPGDPLVINSITYQYQGVISKSTGEAEIFLLSRNDKKCVFKLYYPNFKPKEDIVKRLKQINNDHIVNLFDYGYHQDRFYEIMDYAEGGSIEQHLPIKDIDRIKQIIVETINAFEFCHANGIIHKDIKPQNLYYRNVDGSDILIGDFGISTMLEAGISRHLTSQSFTVGYAAPEMYGIGGKAYVGKEVDYYALGITIIHIWDGKNPFAELSIHAISNITTSGKIRIPGDMPTDLQHLVKGLITIDYTQRWGHDEIKRWLKGEDVPVFFHVKEISYPPYQFASDETATTAVEMAGLLKKYPDRGKKQLYSKRISAWINLFNQGLSSDLDIIVEDDYPASQDAGLQKAIYLLDLDYGFITKNGRQCKSAEELADALEADDSLYVKELPDPNHPFYLYLEAHDAKKEADAFRKYFKTFSAKKALNTTILELRGRDSFKLGNKLFFSPEELLKYKDQQYLIAELKDTESTLSLWIEGPRFTDIIKQVEKWRSLDWHDEVTLAYALSEKNARLLSKETLKTINDNYIIPHELNRALQSNDSGVFFAAIERFMQLKNTRTLIEKKKYVTLLEDYLIPKELDDEIRSITIARHLAAVNILNDLRTRNLLITKEKYQSLKKYVLPKSIREGLADDSIDTYTNAAKALQQEGLVTKVELAAIYSLIGLVAIVIVCGILFLRKVTISILVSLTVAGMFWVFARRYWTGFSAKLKATRAARSRSCQTFWFIKVKTLILYAFATIAFAIFMSIRFPHMRLSPGNFFSGEWLKMNLVSLIIWYGVMVLGMSALFYRRIFWKGAGIFTVLVIFLLMLGLRPGFMLEGTSSSIPFFTEVPADNLLLDLMAKTEPTIIVYPFIPKNMNDYRKLFPVKQYDVIGVKWTGYFRFGWTDLLGKAIDQGTVFYGKYANLMRDPYAHPRSPVIGAKDGKLQRISSFKGPDNRELKRTFFLMVEREGGGETVILPTNVPKQSFFYGDRSEGFYSAETLYVWHFSKEVLK